MPWFKIDDGMHCHPKILAAGNAAAGLWARCGSYVSDQTTDGFVPEILAKTYGKPSEIARLLDVGLWTKVPGGYLMHDYLEYNPSAEKVQADRDAAAERQREFREKRAAEKAASRRDSRVTHPHPVTRDKHDPDPTRPDPTPSSLTSVRQNITSEVPGGVMAQINEWSERRRMS